MLYYVPDPDYSVITVTDTINSCRQNTSEVGGFTLIRSTTTGILNVPYTLSGTAVNGSDYETLSGNAVFENGRSSTSVNIVPVSNRVDIDKTVGITISNTMKSVLSDGLFSTEIDVEIINDKLRTYAPSAGSAKIIGGEKGYVNPNNGEHFLMLVTAPLTGEVTVKVYSMLEELIWEKSVFCTAGVTATVIWECPSDTVAGIYTAYFKGAGVDIKKKTAIVSK